MWGQGRWERPAPGTARHWVGGGRSRRDGPSGLRVLGPAGVGGSGRRVRPAYGPTGFTGSQEQPYPVRHTRTSATNSSGKRGRRSTAETPAAARVEGEPASVSGELTRPRGRFGVRQPGGAPDRGRRAAKHGAAARVGGIRRDLTDGRLGSRSSPGSGAGPGAGPRRPGRPAGGPAASARPAAPVSHRVPLLARRPVPLRRRGSGLPTLRRAGGASGNNRNLLRKSPGRSIEWRPGTPNRPWAQGATAQDGAGERTGAEPGSASRGAGAPRQEVVAATRPESRGVRLRRP